MTALHLSQPYRLVILFVVNKESFPVRVYQLIHAILAHKYHIDDLTLLLALTVLQNLINRVVSASTSDHFR